MQNQSHSHSSDPDGKPSKGIISTFSLDVMAKASTLDDKGYFQDYSGNIFRWEKVADGTPPREPAANSPGDKGKQPMVDTPTTHHSHPDHRQSSETSQHTLETPITPQEDYSRIVSSNFSSLSYRPGPSRDNSRMPASDCDNHSRAPPSGLYDRSHYDGASEDKIPVVETGGYPPGQPPDSMFPIPVNDMQDTFSSGDSILRECEGPGEQLIYDSPNRALMLASKPGETYHEGAIRVFHDKPRKQMRMYFKTASYAESQLIPEKKGSIIPFYAYSTHDTNVVSVHDNLDTDKKAQVVPRWFIKFHKTDDLLDFQGSLTGENVVLHIPSVRSFKIDRYRSLSKETFSGSLRLQLWNEPRTQRRLEGPAGPIISNGTTLSGPLRELIIPNSSKLVVFLARTEGFFMCYITDDIIMTPDPAEPCVVKLKARQYDFRHLTRSRSGVMGNIYKRKKLPAGFQLLNNGINPDEQDDFTSYGSVVIEFETETDQLQFTDCWKKLIRARREQRMEIEQVRIKMARHGSARPGRSNILL